MINLERLCLAVGFNKEQIATLLTDKPVEYSGELYSEEHKRYFMAKKPKPKYSQTTVSLFLRLTCVLLVNGSRSNLRSCGRTYIVIYRPSKKEEE